MYSWEKTTTDQLKFLPVLEAIFTSPDIFVWASEKVDRISQDGLATVRGTIGKQTVGVAYNDFRVNGGSFGQELSKRLCAFVEELSKTNSPLIFIFNTIGLRIMEGRTAFDDAFKTVPAILNHKKCAPVFCLSMGLTLGLGAVLFKLGHYRVATEKESFINLTGPEVMKMFFGHEVSFEAIASARSQFANSTLIHEITATKEAAANKFQKLILFSEQEVDPLTHHSANEVSSFGEHIGLEAMEHLNTPEKNIKQILNYFSGNYIEVFNQLNPIVRTFLVKHHGQLVGVFVNPPGNPNNIITSATLQRYQYALDLFQALEIPIISFLDTAGIDPRTQNAKDKDIITEFATTAQKIIDYPYSKMGFFCGRGYGGANVLGMPKIYGAKSTYAIQGSRVGIMHPSLIETLLSGSPRLLEKWQQARAKETDDLKDLIEKQTVDGIVTPEDVPGIINHFMINSQIKDLIKTQNEATNGLSEEAR
ncbi:MAG: hypothetical protein IPM57_11245 [Oligoflexia bacterium]|nr:hypothetical protein [Oligoflexia bacterium]